MATAAVQRVVIFSGRVQGVGFRWTTQRLAGQSDVTGYVRNLEDGRVELVTEGSAREIERLLADLREQMGGNIRSELAETRPATGHFPGFEIRH
jgi:acylphosphatase